MQKTIKINDKQTLTLNNNIYWMQIYKNQYGRDILPILMPFLSATLKTVAQVMSESTGDDGKIDLCNIPPEVIDDALIELSTLSFTDFIGIAWALVKCADENAPDPDTWMRSLDKFPLDVLAPGIFSLVAEGCMSSKNWKRLQDLKNQVKTLKPSLQTTSFSQQSNAE